ncbi:MAG: phage terminase large subunit [Armatimonadota bacterium]|nr:phage terminase large subunit [Armatimonadota bacterium]
MRSPDVPEAALSALATLLPPVRVPYCPLVPTVKQELFLLLDDLEVFFGGAAGPGKSVGLLMAALQYVDRSGYDALLLRPSLTEFTLPGGLVDMCHDWLGQSGAAWSAARMQWRFPSGATLTFGYARDVHDVGRYAGTQFSFLGFDELTRFRQDVYLRMFRVLRQRDDPSLAGVPVRVRSASNPGGPGHAWVKSRFIDPRSRPPGVVYLPARMEDNPYLDRQAYLAALANLPPAERERLIRGDWDVVEEGALFRYEWLRVVDQWRPLTRAVRYWDLAATEVSATNPDPDWTVGLRLEHDLEEGVFVVRHIIRGRWSPGRVERLVAETAAADGPQVPVVVEQEPGSAGKLLVDRIRRHVLPGYVVRGHQPSGDKLLRAQPVAAAAEHGLLVIVRGEQVLPFIDELVSFPHGPHDDCVDALSGAHAYLSRAATPLTVSSPARIMLPGHDPLA